ncbi:unnamed protein product [Zymoseptoria tritici ST99CH_1E4]|nr:unnamed protein product [Zymoseptoria tritici ST99CH_1E4]
MAPLTKLLSLALLAASSATAIQTSLGVNKTPGKVRREIEARKQASHLSRREDTDPTLLYQEHNISVPIDHFFNDSRYEPHTDESFPLRYWFDASHYQPGGPVFVLQSGEFDSVARLPFMQKGIVAQVAAATHGIGVVLEHRYYGTSFPVANLTNESLRFLTTEQALADAAFFAQHIQFPGLEEFGDLTSNTTAWITYGGSYAGAFSAFLRIQYPDIFWGAISSSGVTKAIYDYWEYMEPIAEYAPQDCVATHKAVFDIVDTILISKNDSSLSLELKTAFGYPNITYDDDFAGALISGLQYWQSLNWDPEMSYNYTFEYCSNITTTDVLYPETESKRTAIEGLISEGGYQANTTFVNNILNMIGWLQWDSAANQCSEGVTQDECYGTHYSTPIDTTLANADYLTWQWQTCTEWGFFFTANVPKGELPIISRFDTLERATRECREQFNITGPPDVERVNKYGGYDIAYPRLGFIAGQWDPWTPATPHAFKYGAKNRTSTVSQPFIEIEAAVHHWDENGVFPNETTADFPPRAVQDAQAREVETVLEWMSEWKARCEGESGGSPITKADL